MSGSITWRKIGFGEREVYKDRKEAAEFLALKLKEKYRDSINRENAVILAIPRGDRKTVELSKDVVDIETAKSEYKKGILEITFNKKERPKGKEIRLE